MMRDCAGLDESDDSPDVDSAGPGDCGSSFGGPVMGKEERRRLWPPSPWRGVPILGDGPPPRLCVRTAVVADVFREIFGRIEMLIGVPGPFPSLRGSGESLLTDRADVVL